MEDWIVEVREVHKRFGAVTAVDAVSLRVARGEIFALLGPNGAGKSTLMRMILGLQRPDRGSVTHRPGGTGRAPLPGETGYLPEDRGLYPDVAVLPTIVFFGVLRGMERGAARREALGWLERMGLSERAGEPLKALSKGNQQKVQFLTAVLHRPALAVLDEPFSGLDPLNQELFLGLLHELREGGTTVLLAAHQMDLVERVADRMMVMARGRAVLHGTLAEIRACWPAERRVVLRFDERPAFEPLSALPAVVDAAWTGEAELTIMLEGGAPLGPVLVAAAALDVRELHSAPLTLHQAYVRAVGGEAEPVTGVDR
jgi:ABC-2 type transport system ATP-binding protein